MIEVKLQRLIVDAMVENDAFAFKLSNRFLVGVPDILVHIPYKGTSIWEVKKNPFRHDPIVKVGVTQLQRKFLQNYSSLGGICGVISFVIGEDNLKVRAIPVPEDFTDIEIPVPIASYTDIPKGKRLQTIYDVIYKAYDES